MFTDNPPYQEVVIDLSFMADMTTTLWGFKVDESDLIEPDWETYKTERKLTTNYLVYENTLANLSTTDLSMAKLMDSVNYTIGVTKKMPASSQALGSEMLKIYF